MITEWRVSVTKTLLENARESVPFQKTAPHIRGRVFKRGPTWHMQVINTRTGVILASDNTNSYAVMRDEARAATAAARGAWIYNFRQRLLK